MRFILLEDAAANDKLGITPERIKEFQTASPSRRKTLTHIILNNMKDPDVMKLANAFSKSCIEFGIDTNKNPFIMFIPQLAKKARVDKKHDEHVCALIDLVLQGWIPAGRIQQLNDGLRKDGTEYLLNSSLYYRNIEEFLYTVKIFETALDPSRLAKYFRSRKGISVKDLYDDKGKIKPAGTTDDAENTDTIFGTVEAWSGKGKNDKAEKKPKKASDGKSTSKRKGTDSSGYSRVAFLTDEDKARIREQCKAKNIYYLSDVDKPYVGQLVFVYGENRRSQVTDGLNIHDPDAGYYVYQDKGNIGIGWQKVAEPGRDTIYVPDSTISGPVQQATKRPSGIITT